MVERWHYDRIRWRRSAGSASLGAGKGRGMEGYHHLQSQKLVIEEAEDGMATLVVSIGALLVAPWGLATTIDRTAKSFTKRRRESLKFAVRAPLDLTSPFVFCIQQPSTIQCYIWFRDAPLTPTVDPTFRVN